MGAWRRTPLALQVRPSARIGSPGPRPHAPVGSLSSRHSHVYRQRDSHPWETRVPRRRDVPRSGQWAPSFPERIDGSAALHVRAVGRGLAWLAAVGRASGGSGRRSWPFPPGAELPPLSSPRRSLVFPRQRALWPLLFGALLFVRRRVKLQASLAAFSAASHPAGRVWGAVPRGLGPRLLVLWELFFSACERFLIHQLRKPGLTYFTPRNTR